MSVFTLSICSVISSGGCRDVITGQRHSVLFHNVLSKYLQTDEEEGKYAYE